MTDFQQVVINHVTSVILVDDVAKLIEEYAQIRVPSQIKHMRTTWIKWWHEICQKQSYKEEVLLTVQKHTKDDKFPQWLAPTPGVGRITRNLDPNYWAVDQYINIVGLNEGDGSITTTINGLNQLIVLVPAVRENRFNFDASRVTIFRTLIQLPTCAITIEIGVDQPEDFDFKLVKSSVSHQKDHKHFVKDKRLRDLRNSLQALSEVYSPQDITDMVQSAHNSLYKLKIEAENKQLITLFAKLQIPLHDYAVSARWREAFDSKELQTEVMNGKQWFCLIHKVTNVEYYEDKHPPMYLEIGQTGSKTTFETLIDRLLFEFQRTIIDRVHEKAPIFYRRKLKVLGGILHFDGVGWAWQREDE